LGREGDKITMPSEFVPLLKTTPLPVQSPKSKVPSPLRAVGSAPEADAGGGDVGLGTLDSGLSAPSAVPSVSLERDGDRVTHIRIQCGCGQLIELECAY